LCVVLDPGQPTAGTCLALCVSDAECGARICDPNLGLCVDAPVPECAQDEDCASTQICQSGTCVAAPPPVSECASDGDCPGAVCDLQLGQCVAGPQPPLECTLDEDCPDGVCNPSTSACIAAPAIPVGGACSANADCVGNLCVTLAGSKSCSAACVWGTDQGCEAYGIDAFCVLPLPPPNDDLGVCTELCNTAADCAQAGYECVDIGVTISGRTGTCLPPAPATPAQPAAAPSP
jgi:hypothetical protein